MNNLSLQIKNSFKKTNKRNIKIQSFLGIGIIGCLGVTFFHGLGFLPGLLLGSNGVSLLLELKSKKLIDTKSPKEIRDGLFSLSARYNKDLLNHISKYLDTGTTTTEKAYKLYYSIVLSEMLSPYDIYHPRQKEVDISFFSHLKSNLSFFLNKTSNIDKANIVDIFSPIAIKHKIDLFTPTQISIIDEDNEIQIDPQIYLDINNSLYLEQNKNIAISVAKEFASYSFFANNLISSSLHYISNKELKTYEPYQHYSSKHLTVFLSMQDYKLSFEDRDTFSKINSLIEDGTIKNFNHTNLTKRDLINLIENNTTEEIKPLLDFLRLINVKPIVHNHKLLHFSEIEPYIEKQIIAKSAQESNKQTTTTVNKKRKNNKL